MRKLAIVLVLFSLILPAFALDLTILTSGQTIYVTPVGGYKSADEKVIADFEAAHPGVKVKQLLVDLSTGSSMSMDAMIAAGSPPDVYSDFGGRSGRYAIDAFALDMNAYLTPAQKADYVPSLLAYGNKGGKQLALPLATWAQGFAVNTDLLASVGYKLPASWTTDDFLKLAALIKPTGKYVTTLFAKNQSSDSWWMGYFAAFGATQFANADYTRTRLNSPQGIAALNFMKLLVDKGYVPPGPAEIDDDIALEQWAKGQVAALVMQSSHAPPAIKSAVDQKMIDKAFAYTFVEMPHAPGLAHTPTTAGPTLIVVHKSTDAARNKLAAELAFVFGGKEYLTEMARRPGSFPALKSVANTADDFGGKLIQGIMSAAGVWDMGIVLPQFSEIRAQMFPLLQEFYADRLTAPQVLSIYETKVNAILAKK